MMFIHKLTPIRTIMNGLLNNIFRISLIGLLTVFFSTKLIAQTIDNNKVSTDLELNFIHTEKRGIKSSKGFIYLVDSDYQTLIAFDSNKNIKWKVNIIEKCGEPVVGKPEIRFIKLNKEVVEILFGKHDFATVNLTTGKVIYSGAD